MQVQPSDLLPLSPAPIEEAEGTMAINAYILLLTAHQGWYNKSLLLQ